MMREIPIEKNDDIEFTIDALGSEGQGIGRVDGYTVFVPLALPGEKIRAHVIKTTSGYGVAKLTEVMEPSKDRAQQDCPAYPRCGGCSMRHMSYAAQLAAKTKQVRDAFIRLGRFDGSEINVQPCHGMEHPETGHILIPRRTGDDIPCTCRFHQSCVEGLASGPMLERRTGMKGKDIPADSPVWDLEAFYIAEALVNYTMCYSVERIVLGGGVMDN